MRQNNSVDKKTAGEVLDTKRKMPHLSSGQKSGLSFFSIEWLREGTLGLR